jgi:hypothetical protein
VRDVPGLPFAVTRELFAFRCDSDLGQYAAVKAGRSVVAVPQASGASRATYRFCTA